TVESLLLASGGAGCELLSIWGHWARGTLQQAYLEKNPLSALVAFAIAAGWDETSFMRRHFCGRALVSVPESWIDSLLPGVSTVLGEVQARNARLQSGKRQADDAISDRAAEGFLQTALLCTAAFASSGHRAIQDPEAVAKFIAEKVTAMNMSSDSVPKDSGKGLALPVLAAKQKVVLPDMLADAKRHKASLIQAPTLYDSSGSISTVALAWKEWCSGPAQRTIAQRVLEIKAHKHMSLGERNSNLHKKNRHLPQLIELIGYGATADQAVNLMTHMQSISN
ncbi:TPA: hypothetical protein ACH3X1_009109, partial [Trebouxia sp. C0004]